MSNKPLETAVLTIAGSDSCGGAGIQADLKTFNAFGVYGASVVTALTAQNTLGVEAVELTSPQMVGAQLRRVLDDLPIKAIKTGMLGQTQTVELMVDILGQYPGIPIVMDPVMIATSGARLADPETILSMHQLARLATLVTPNLDELAILSGIRVECSEDLQMAAQAMLDSGCRAVLLKGGHFETGDITDLYASRETHRQWQHARLPGRFHGTGCTLAAAIAAGLALGHDLESAIDGAIRFVQGAMRHGRVANSGRLTLLDHQHPFRKPG